MKRLGYVLVSFLVFGQCGAASQETQAVDNIKQQIQTAFPDFEVDNLVKSPIDGLYQVTSGPVVLYASNDGRYLLSGDVLDLARNEDRNITESVRKEARVAALKKISAKEMVVYSPKELKAVVTVFTDPDCGYCRKLHAEISQLLDLGIELRYLAFPRQGVGSPTYTKMESVWCSKDPKEAMTNAMQGEAVSVGTCSSAKEIEAQLELGQKIGINGTPTLVFADGTLVGGYLSAEKLAKEAIKHNLKH